MRMTNLKQVEWPSGFALHPQTELSSPASVRRECPAAVSVRCHLKSAKIYTSIHQWVRQETDNTTGYLNQLGCCDLFCFAMKCLIEVSAGSVDVLLFWTIRQRQRGEQTHTPQWRLKAWCKIVLLLEPGKVRVLVSFCLQNLCEVTVKHIFSAAAGYAWTL